MSGWWVKLGVPVAVLVVVVVAVIVTGGDDDGDSTPVATEPPATPAAPQAPANPEDDGRPAGDSRSEGGESTATPEASPAPVDEASPEGRPAGKVKESDGAAGDERAVVRTVRAYLRAIARGNGLQACAQLSPTGQKAQGKTLAKVAPEIAGAPCESFILLYQAAYGDAINDPVVTDVQVSGNSATAMGPLRERALLSKRREIWLIDRYGN